MLDRSIGVRRVDIQALRGIAVLLVVLYHSGISIFPSGFLGVDIFFVISGYLITNLIIEEKSKNKFSFVQFYYRRARRLLPAAYVVFAAVTVLSPLFLDAAAIRDLPAQLIGAVTYTANFVLAGQSGYFDLAADQKPLLHIWSLAIEEQYYLLMPILLIVLQRRLLIWAVSALIVVSALLCILPVFDATQKFFLLPTRAWQLGIGSLAALANQERLKYLTRPLIPVALIALVVPALLPINGPQPGIGAIIVCLATVIIIIAESPYLQGDLLKKSLGFIGDFSYSLYLIHWPLFVFFRQAWMGETPTMISLALALAAVALGYLLYRMVEAPIHHASKLSNRAVLSGTVAATVAICAFAIILKSILPENYVYVEWKANRGLSDKCEFDLKFEPISECVNSAEPTVLVWGDSFGMHLVPGIIASMKNIGIAQATKSVCGPTLDVAPMELRPKYGYGRKWAEGCLLFNQSVLEYLAATPSIKTVVLSSSLRQYIDQDGYAVLKKTGDSAFVSEPISVDLAVYGIGNTVRAIRAMGKSVVLVAPPPTGRFSSNICIQRMEQDKMLFGPYADCNISVAAYRHNERKVLEALRMMAASLSLEIIRFDEVLCNKLFCATAMENIPLYGDPYHLSVDGSRILGAYMNLYEKINRVAR